MDRGATRIAIGSGSLAVVIALVGFWARTDSRNSLSLPPAVGRSEKEVEAGVDPRLAHVPARIPQPLFRLRRAVRAVTAQLEEIKGPKGADHAIIYPFKGALPAWDLEEGPVWHLVFEKSGKLVPGRRLLEGQRARPPGMPARALKAWHVAIPEALRFSPERVEAQRALLVYLDGRFGGGPSAFVIADAVPGASFELDAAIDRDLFSLPAER